MDKPSSSSPSDNFLIEEKEELMVLSEKNICLMKTQFLKPFSSSIDDVAKLPRRDQTHSYSSFSSKLKGLSSPGTFCGFWYADTQFISWYERMKTLYEPIWRKAGIFEAIKASTYKINKNMSLILSIAEKWCSETKSFVFPWGEATITLEDVMVLLGFSVIGSPAFSPSESSEMRESANKLEKVRQESIGKSKQVTKVKWISRFLGRGDQMEHEAFLALWLSYFVFPGTTRPYISRHVIPIAVRLAAGERIALAPAVLAILYKDLDRIYDFSRGRCTGKVNFKSLFKVVQVWIWERFMSIRPKAREISKCEPRIARWHNLQQICSNVRLSFDDYDWRPYTKPLKNWNQLQFYLEKDYFPHRVAMQFGLAQDLPGLVTYHSKFRGKDTWGDYNKSLNGLKFYMPSHLNLGIVTVRYRDWWLKSVSDFLGSEEMQKELTEAFYARITSEHHDQDDDNVKQACEDDDEGSMDEEDDNMTIAQMMRSRKRYSNVEKNNREASELLRKRTRRYLATDSDDDSGSCQKLGLRIVEEMREEEEKTVKDPEITRQRCDDVNESNAEKKMIDDATKKAEKSFCSEVKKEEDDESLRQIKLVMQKALELEARFIEVEETLTNIRIWKTGPQNGVSA